MTTVTVSSMSLQALVIVLYLGLLAILGTLGWAASRSSEGEYYLAGRRQGWVITSLTISATFFSSMAVLGVPGMNFAHGYGIVGGSLSLMLAGVLIWFFGTRIRRLGKRHGFVTQAELFAHHYGGEGIRISVCLIGATYVITYVIMQIMAGGIIFQQMVGREYRLAPFGFELTAFETGVIGMSVITAAYTMAGGMRSVAWTDALQGLLLIVGMWISAAVVFLWIGGPAEIFAQVAHRDPSRLTLPGPQGAFPIATLFTVNLAIAFGNLLQPAQWMRYYAAGSSRVLKRSALVFAFILCGTMFFATNLVGIGGWIMFPDLSIDQADQIVLMILEKAPTETASTWASIWPVFSTLFLTAVLAASMSTADSNLHAAAAMLTKDIYHRYIHGRAATSQLLWIGRLTIAGLTGVAVAIVLSGHTDAIATIGFLAASFTLQLLPITIDVLFLKRGSRSGAIAGLVAGLVVLVFFAAPPFLASWWPKMIAVKSWLGIHFGVWGLMANTLVFVSVTAYIKTDTSGS